MSRVPNTGPVFIERADLLAFYRKRLNYYRNLPLHRRDAEHADAGERDMQVLIAELEAKDVRAARSLGR